MLTRLVPASVVAVAMVLVGAAQAWIGAPGSGVTVLPTVALTAALVLLSTRFPGWALAGTWALLGLHLVWQAPLVLAEVGVGFIAFACAAWGTRATMWAALASIPAGAYGAVLLVLGWLNQSPWEIWTQLRGWGLADAAMLVRDAAWGWQVVLGLVGLLLLVVPWLAGVAVRLRRASDVSARQQVAAEAERDAAEEVATVREAQAQLARDVHDVVGHSLTVILAQAEAGQYQQSPEDLHRTLGTIADTARSSLTDVRRVLEDTGSHRLPPAEHELTTLLDGVRAGGREVRFTDEGTVRPLPPDRAAVAHRVLQEMLTNAVRHGRPDAPITVERHWAGDLRLEVSNALPDPSGPPAPSAPTGPGQHDLTVPIQLPGIHDAPAAAGRRGHGVAGMQRRLEAVGGRLDVRRRAEQGTFTATAWIPLPGRLEQP